MARIGIDARYLENETTGLGRYSYNLLVHLLEQDRKNTYRVLIRETYTGSLPAHPNVIYVRVPYPPISLASLFALSRRVRKLELDLWHAHFPVAPLFSGTPFLVTVHDLQPLRVPSMGGQRPLPLRAAYRAYYPLVYGASLTFSRAVVAVSIATCEEIQDVFRIPREKIHVIHEALDDRFSPEGRSTHFNTEDKRHRLPSRFLLYVGATLPHKNLDTLLKGFAKALRQPGTGDLGLVIAGRPSRFDPQWTNLAQRLEIFERIHRIGHVAHEELSGLYNQASALVHVCRYEGFGFPPLEAMQHGLPVIAASHTSLPEVVGTSALLVEPGDVDGVARAILKTLHDEALCKRLRKHGEVNLKRFRWKDAATKTLSLYETILGSPC